MAGVTPISFQQPQLVVIPGRRRYSRQPPTRGGDRFGSGDQISFKVALDTSQNEYLDLKKIRVRYDRLWAEFDSIPVAFDQSNATERREVELVKGGPQNLIQRLEMVLNDSMDVMPTIDEYARFYNLQFKMAVDQYGRKEMDYSVFQDLEVDDVVTWQLNLMNDARWTGRDVYNDPMLNGTGSVPLMFGFSSSTRYFPVRMAAGAQLEIIITLAPDDQVVLPMVRADNQVVEQPRYYVRMPELTCEFVRTNQLTQAELAQATAVQGGIALNYVYPHLVKRQIPASSTEDWLTFNSLSKSMNGWMGYVRPVLSEAKPLVCHEPMAPSKAVASGSSPVIANKSFSGWEYDQNKHFDFLPLPVFGDGEVQTQLGDIKYPQKPREWRRRLYDNRNWGNGLEPSAWDYPQSSVQSYVNVVKPFKTLMNTSATYECQRDVFDANPFWPSTEQARWNPIADPEQGENIRVVTYANSKAKSSGSNKYPTQSDWMMCEYLSALKPGESRLTQSGVDVDRVGNHAQIRVRRPDVSATAFPHGFAYIDSGQKYASNAVDIYNAAPLALGNFSGQPVGYNYQTPGNTSRWRPFHYQFKLTDAAVPTTIAVAAASGALDGAYLQINAGGTQWARILRSTWDGTNFTVTVMAPFQYSVVSTWTSAVGISFQRNSGYHTATLGNHFIMDNQEECSCFLVVTSGALANIAAMEREFLGKWMCMTPNTGGTPKNAASVMGQIVAVDALGITNFSITGGTPTSTWTTPDAFRVGSLVINVTDIQGGVWSTTALANAWQGARVITKEAGLFYGGTIQTNTAITTTSQASVTLGVKWDTGNVMGTGGTFAGDAVESFVWIYANTSGSAGTTECQITMRGVRRFDWRVNPSRRVRTNADPAVTNAIVQAQETLSVFGIGSVGWITDDYQTINDLTNDHLDFTLATGNSHLMNPITYLEYYIWALENRTVFWSNSGQIAVSH